jgi:hypothetical protein
MAGDILKLFSFRLSGKRRGGERDRADERDLRPALFAAYRELAKLRYDFPLVLVEGVGDEGFVRTLSGLVDEVLQAIAPRGADGERTRRQVLGLEQEIRGLVAGGATGPLSRLWVEAETTLVERADQAGRESLRESLGRARDALGPDGEVIDCDQESPVRLITHAWGAVQADKARRFRRRIDELALKLSSILKADFLRSDEGRSPELLRGSVGTAYESVFDFEAMSRILPKASPERAMPENRRQRIRAALSVLETQSFVALEHPGRNGGSPEAPHGFAFESCAAALDAFRERLPEMAALVKAIAIAGLEIENRYREAKHDAFFAGFDESTLAPSDLALFPSYLICLRERGEDAAERAKLIEALSSGLAMKVLVRHDDIAAPSLPGAGQFAFGVERLRLAAMTVGLGSAYVLQSSASNLYQARHRILAGMSHEGPALFSVFTGAAGSADGVAPYLSAAAAMHARAFPAFSYDPGAGPDLAARFSIGDNPQVERDWPRQRLGYEGPDLQRRWEEVAFTFVDFVAGDRRHAGHFAAVARERWDAAMVPVSEYLALEAEAAALKVPYVLMVDQDDVLHRVIVGEAPIAGARRCAEMWRTLQEQGGIDNSYARAALSRERELWEEEKAQEIEALKQAPSAATAAEEAPAPAPEAAAEAAEAVEEGPGDEPYIETLRCTTCDECTNLNNRMFAYDDNKQAYIVDLGAGTYREMVEAAEACQVAIIRPGKPWNPDEPGLDELIERAEAFN